MHILTWLKNKAGKLPISMAQLAGITAVVGAAGVAAVTYLSSPADDNNSFIPPSAYEQQSNQVYVPTGGSYQGASTYDGEGRLRSSAELVGQSKSIALANERYAQQERARSLEGRGTEQFVADEPEADVRLPAAALGGGEKGLGTENKFLGDDVMNMLANAQKGVPGLEGAMAQAQAQAAQQQGATKGAAATTSGQTAAQLANAPRNWGQGGGGNSGGANNAFVVQNSGKNQNSQEAAAALAKAGNALADARAAMANMPTEGARMRGSRANFGLSDGLGKNREGAEAPARYGNKGKDELAFVHSQTKKIATNKTNSANEGGRPFLASTKLSGGLVVDGENVTLGQNSFSGDLRSTADRQMRGIGAKLAQVQATEDEKAMRRSELKSWLWQIATAAIAAILLITALVSIAKSGGIFTAWAWVAAAAATAAILAYIWWRGGVILGHYNGTCGSDKWTTLWWVTSGILTAGVGAAWFAFSGAKLGNKIKEFLNITDEKWTNSKLYKLFSGKKS